MADHRQVAANDAAGDAVGQLAQREPGAGLQLRHEVEEEAVVDGAPQRLASPLSAQLRTQLT
ncbi:hypothetical protein WL14_31005 [Burkholderia cepacia]|nr:hypothetical protein WL14_31005 [Burkholderia cepacia]